MNLFLIALSLLGGVSGATGDVLREQVDLVELNHFYDEHGRLVFDQIIFYDWCDNVKIPEKTEHPVDHCQNVCDKPVVTPGYQGARYQVVAWRLLKHPNQIPQRDWKNGGYSSFWADGGLEHGQLRHVIAKSFRETWTQYDPELEERNFLDKVRRRELRRPKPVKSSTNTPSTPTSNEPVICPDC